VSAILTIVRTDGAPIEPTLAAALMSLLAVRGPDAQRSQCIGNVALGHALLRTRTEEDDRQPLTLDGHTWIVGDVRLDARADLISQLGLNLDSMSLASDAELVLRAYHKWGVRCINQLLGDFGFAIWDVRLSRLFVGRDHLGVKPMYYAHVGRSIVVSSMLECVRMHPAVDHDELDDIAIADFLLFGHKTDHDTTAFRDIRRLPPAHTLTWSADGMRVQRYWQLPVEEPIYCADAEYAEQFRDLLGRAVSDRLRTDRVAIFLSGGIDSTALAATAVRELGHAEAVRGFTFVRGSLVDDDEDYYASIAARELGITARCYDIDDRAGWPYFMTSSIPEPLPDAAEADAKAGAHADMMMFSPVAFFGEGPDNAMHYEWQAYVRYLWRGHRWWQMSADFVRFVRHHKRLPLGSTIWQLGARSADERDTPQLPRWIAPSLVARLQLRERWQRVMRGPRPSPHPTKPMAYWSLLNPMWHVVFDADDPAYTGVPIDVRHPYLDLRLLRFLLRVPAIPWARDKHLFRYALSDRLPAIVRTRPKTPLKGLPDYERGRRFGLPTVRASEELERYGSSRRLLDTGFRTAAEAEADLRFIALSYWLEQRRAGARLRAPATITTQ